MLSEFVAVKITTHRQPVIIAACYRSPKKTVLAIWNNWLQKFETIDYRVARPIASV